MSWPTPHGVTELDSDTALSCLLITGGVVSCWPLFGRLCGEMTLCSERWVLWVWCRWTELIGLFTFLTTMETKTYTRLYVKQHFWQLIVLLIQFYVHTFVSDIAASSSLILRRKFSTSSFPVVTAYWCVIPVPPMNTFSPCGSLYRSTIYCEAETMKAIHR